MLVSLAEQLEEERRTRLVAVFEQINTNFTRAYKLLQPGGEGELQLENPKNPFEGGLRMACIPPGKSKRTRRSFLSGGEKSMAALAFVFAIQDYEPSPFYYFDEVDQNLDPFNAERIATLCRIRSTHAQFIMVTLRKVSLTLADHHIGITHAGDGCSRRIADFNRAAAIELGEEFEAEQEAIAEAQKAKENMGDLPTEEAMPKVPEPMERPQSLGGLADRAGVEVTDEEILGEELPEVEAVSADASDASDAESTLTSLIERTEEWSEDIAEKEASTPLADDEEVAVATDEVAGEVETEQELE
jgi:chromosome segregation protein